jgi:[ribosomal protein S18]-alanine N-acetyltransferase
VNREVTLRPARTTDAATMAAMSRQLIEAGLAWRYTPQRIGALMADDETIALVACDDAGAVQGFAVMQFGDDTAHLVLLCVRTARQRCGIGARLVEWLLQSARVAGITRVGVELRADNAGALVFYRRLGFVETRVLHGYYGGSVDARCMALDLQAGSSQA